MEYWFTAYTTFISALLGVGFALAAVFRERGNGRANALYLLARGLALTFLAAIPLRAAAPGLLLTVTAAMMMLQLADALIGISLKSRLRTFGPLFLAGCHGVGVGMLM